jgi:hypothetical protein
MKKWNLSVSDLGSRGVDALTSFAMALRELVASFIS